MEDGTFGQISRWLQDPTFKLYEERIRELADGLRMQADLPEVEIHNRLWLLAKAQGLDEALRQPLAWLKEK